jgi:hypothetical protein
MKSLFLAIAFLACLSGCRTPAPPPAPEWDRFDYVGNQAPTSDTDNSSSWLTTRSAP